LLDSIRKGQRWLTLLFVSVIGLVFVFFFGVGGSFGPGETPSGNAIIQLDDVKLTQRDFARVREETRNRLQAELGDAYEQLGADRFVDSQALSALLNSVVLASAAEEMGLLVTKEELRRVVQASPAFRDETGRFSPEAFDRFARYNYGSQRAFIRSFTRDLLGQKLVQLIVRNTRVSEAEVDLHARHELEEVRIAYVSLPTDRLPADITLDESEVEAYAETHEESLRALYAERLEDLTEPERVRARHVLILAPEDASAEEETEARARAEAARERILAGESFEEVPRTSPRMREPPPKAVTSGSSPRARTTRRSMPPRSPCRREPSPRSSDPPTDSMSSESKRSSRRRRRASRICVSSSLGSRRSAIAPSSGRPRRARRSPAPSPKAPRSKRRLEPKASRSSALRPSSDVRTATCPGSPPPPRS